VEVGCRRSLRLTLPKGGLRFQRQVEVPVSFDGVVIRSRVEFTVWKDTDELILESKARQSLLSEGIQQGLCRICIRVATGCAPSAELRAGRLTPQCG